MTMRITHCPDEPEAIDEIVAENASVHIERLDDGLYWMRIGDKVFHLSTKKRGRAIITAEKISWPAFQVRKPAVKPSSGFAAKARKAVKAMRQQKSNVAQPMTDTPNKEPPMRHCFNCGAEMGRYRDYDRSDTCGKPECDREARAMARQEREEAHELLDRSRGWDRW